MKRKEREEKGRRKRRKGWTSGRCLLRRRRRRVRRQTLKAAEVPDWVGGANEARKERKLFRSAWCFTGCDDVARLPMPPHSLDSPERQCKDSLESSYQVYGALSSSSFHYVVFLRCHFLAFRRFRRCHRGCRIVEPHRALCCYHNPSIPPRRARKNDKKP
jgi:hypothetical protein